MKLMGMRSWKRGLPMEMIDVPAPPLKHKDVRIAVHAIGVNPVDWKMRESGPLRLAARFIGFVRRNKPPVVVGVDFAGNVEAVGAGVTDCKIGDRVVGGCNFSRGQRGSYGDTVVVRGDQICRLPDSVGFDIAGCLPVAGVTAYRALTHYNPIGPGKRVLVLGASGGVGQFAVQLAKRVLQADFVGGVCSGKNTTLVEGLGVDAVFDYGKGDPLVAAKATGPYHVVVDCVGSYSGRACRALLASKGAHVMVAGDSTNSMLQVIVPPFRSKAILGVVDGAHLAPVVQAVAEGKVVVHIAHRLPLGEAEQAHELSRGGRTVGKIVLLAR
jgi:NADPH:quinone reductase-like Zn-dependent oxidoreductase